MAILAKSHDWSKGSNRIQKKEEGSWVCTEQRPREREPWGMTLERGFRVR